MLEDIKKLRSKIERLIKLGNDCYICRHCGNPNYISEDITKELAKLRDEVKRLEKKMSA